MPKHLRLISHKLCPYVQRAAIVAFEKDIAIERIDIDLAAKPDWFLELSPTGKVPLLEVTAEDGSRAVLFESAVIAEYLDELAGERLLSADPLERARERAWIEFASATLGDIWQLEIVPDGARFEAAARSIRSRLEQLEKEIAGGWFNGERFGLVDAAFGPVFRYFDVFERRAGLDLLDRHPKLRAWANALLKRPSVTAAVPADYARRLADFIASKKSHLAKLIASKLPEAA